MAVSACSPRCGGGQRAPLSPRMRLFAGLLCCYALACGASSGVLAESSLPPVNLPRDIAERIAQCWAAPRTDPPQMIEVTVRLSFSRAGSVIGEPRVTYVHAPAVAGLREKITASVLAAIKACTPLPFTPSLGAAIAGRMLAIRICSLPLSGRQRVT